jgi:hypothetical protein
MDSSYCLQPPQGDCVLLTFDGANHDSLDEKPLHERLDYQKRNTGYNDDRIRIAR